jgi:uncharacterized protein (TIGR02285 family)
VRFYFLIVILFKIIPSYAQEVTWLSYDFSPYYILSGSSEGQGRDQLLVKLLQKQLPDYQFSWKQFPTSRIIAELTNSENQYCAISLFNNEQRRKELYISEHFSTLGVPPKVFIRTDILNKFSFTQTDNSYSLEELLRVGKFSLGVAKGRSYGVELDKLIQNEDYSKQIFNRTGLSISKNLMKMVERGRIHMVLGYVDEYKYLSTVLKLENSISVLNLTEASQTTLGYVGCSKNAWGKRVISDIDNALHAAYQHNSVEGAVKSWLPDNTHNYMDELLKSLRNNKTNFGH